MLNFKQKTRGDSGIAIMFTLIMLSIFFLIAFGFISFASSAKSAASAREPKQSTSLTATESVLNEALFAIDKGLYNDKEVADSSKFMDLDFANTGGTPGSVVATVKAWGTKSTDRTSSALEDYLLPQFTHTTDGEIKIDTSHSNWSNLGWLNPGSYKYAWLVIDSNGLDVNYLGNNYATSANRIGKYVRELDVKSLGSAANATTIWGNVVYTNWVGSPPSPWESKKDLINGMSSEYETAIEMLEVGTSPVTIMEKSDAYDLSAIDDSTDIGNIVSGIAWLSNSSSDLKYQIAANIKDYIDADNEPTTDTNYYGNERVPYINEINFALTNSTAAQDPMTAVANATSVALEIEIECANLFGTSSWGSPGGSSGVCEITAEITGTRGSDTVINIPSQAYDVPINLASASSYITGNLSVGALTASDSADPTGDVEITITVTSIKLYGDNKTTEWDAVKEIPAATETISTSSTDYCIFEVEDPRVNWEGSDWQVGWDIGGGSINSANDTIATAYNSSDDSNDYEPNAGNDITQVSSGYMPSGGGITRLEELGLISRGQKFKTLNLVDFDTTSPTAFDENAFRPTGSGSPSTLNLNSINSFDGGDRAILDYVSIGGTNQYSQAGIINPNSSNSKIFNMLFENVTPLAAAAPTATEIDKLVTRFPSITSSPDVDKMFFIDDFHDADTSYHNRNPRTYGYIFSRLHSDNVSSTSNADDLSDAQAEALLLRTMNLISPKYSYFTVLIAVEESGTSTSVYAFVRRDNEGGSFKVIKTIEQVSP